MATKIYFRRGTRPQIEVIVPEQGEPVWATDLKRLYMGDGTTSGGIFVGGESVGVDTLNDLFGAITISGAGEVVVSVVGQVITISGQTDVDTINELIGAVTISGKGTVSVTEEGQIVVISGATSEVNQFTELTDTPSSYTGSAKKIVTVNAGETGLEFAKTINIESELTSDHDYSGLVCSGIAGETLAFGESVYYASDGRWKRTIATVEEQVAGHLALVVASGIEDGSITLLTLGFIRDDDWNWDTSSGLWLATTSGDLTESIPSVSGEFVVKAGWAHAANIVWFKPDTTVIERK